MDTAENNTRTGPAEPSGPTWPPPMLWWWLVSGLATGLFILFIVVTAMYAGLTGAVYADPWWHVLRLIAGCLSVATVATWAASCLARLILRKEANLRAHVDEAAAQLRVHIDEQFAELARGADAERLRAQGLAERLDDLHARVDGHELAGQAVAAVERLGVRVVRPAQ